MSELFEIFMVICFFLSWPISIRKSWVSRTAKGKSVVFEFFLLAGYVFGVVSKLVVGNVSYVMIFYIVNPHTTEVACFQRTALPRIPAVGGWSAFPP